MLPQRETFHKGVESSVFNFAVDDGVRRLRLGQKRRWSKRRKSTRTYERTAEENGDQYSTVGWRRILDPDAMRLVCRDDTGVLFITNSNNKKCEEAQTIADTHRGSGSYRTARDTYRTTLVQTNTAVLGEEIRKPRYARRRP